MNGQPNHDKSTIKLDTRSITTMLVIFALLWCWGNRETLIPKSKVAAIGSLMSNVELIKASPFPDNATMPIGLAYLSVVPKSNWEEFLSVKGVQVVQITGILNNEEIREKILNDTWNIDEVCNELPQVSTFIKKYSVYNETFHGAVLNPERDTEMASFPDFSEAAEVYIKALKDHVNAQVTIKTQFLMFVKKDASDTTPLGISRPFMIGSSIVTLNNGPYAGKELNYNDLPSLVQKY